MEQLNLLNFDFKNDSKAKRNQMVRARKEYFKKNEKCCIRCGFDDQVHLHHIIPIDDDGATVQENLVALCETCHKEYHKYFDGNKSFDDFLKYPPIRDLYALWDVFSSDEVQELKVGDTLEVYNAFLKLLKDWRKDYDLGEETK